MTPVTGTVMGIDVGQRMLHAVVWDGATAALAQVREAASASNRAHAWVRAGVRHLLTRHQPRLVAVDAPCALGHAPDGRRGRLCEYQAVQCVDQHWRAARAPTAAGRAARIGIAPTPHADAGTAPPWMAVGLAVFAALGDAGYDLAATPDDVRPGRRLALEVYPDATFWLRALAAAGPAALQAEAPLPRKRHARVGAVSAARLALLPRALADAIAGQPQFPTAAGARLHYLDAAAAALTAALAARGAARCFAGRAGEGALWLPTCVDPPPGAAAAGGNARHAPAGGEPLPPHRPAETLWPVREKVVAYVLRARGGRTEVAVFDHEDAPEAGAQVPAGTIQPGETPEAACLRELREESGVRRARLVGKLGVYEYVHAARAERHRRHVYVVAADRVPDTWTHRASGDGGDRGLAFRFGWLEVGVAARRLAGEQGAYLAHAVKAFAAAVPAPAAGGVEPGAVEIRAGRREDRAAITRLWVALGQYHRRLERIRPLRWSARTPQMRRRLLEETWAHPARHAIFVAETGARLVGFVRASLSDAGPCPATIDNLFVAADRRGRRIGSRLLERATEWCRERGAVEVCVETIAPNERARALYERAGFQPLVVTHMRRL